MGHAYEYETAKFLNPEFLEMVRQVPCLACRLTNTDVKADIEAHHEALSFRFQFMKRSSDYTALPLCRKHHWERHNLGGMESFWMRFHPDFRIPFYMCINLISTFAGNNNLKLSRKLNKIVAEDLYYNYDETALRRFIDEITEYVHHGYFGEG